MNEKVLVAYGTKHGATAEIAEKIGAVLRDAGCKVEVMSADKVKDAGAYKAVVLGSGVYAGQWVKAAVELLTSQEQALAGKPVWFFSSGPTGEGDPVALMKGWRFPEAQKPIADRLQARDMAFFGGKMEAAQLGFAEKLIVKAIKAPLGDFRNWDAITAWAQGIAAALHH